MTRLPEAASRAASRFASRAVPLSLAIAFALVAHPGCARQEPIDLEVGRHRVRLVAPRGWEHLDHGREHWFRQGETRLSIADLGPAPSPESGVPAARYALGLVSRSDRYVIARETSRRIQGAVWVEIETWDRVTHLGRQRLACLDNGGYLLVFRTDGGLIEQSGPAFESLLTTIDVLPGATSGG